MLSALQVAPRLWKCRVKVDNVVGSMPFSVEFCWELTQQSEAVPEFDLGQCLTHKEEDYRGVIVGWDPKCILADEETYKAYGVDKLARGRNQVFYHVLVDQRDRPGMEMAYVAEELIVPTSAAPIEHPELYIGFGGEVDEESDVLLPNESLREQWPRGIEGCWLVDRFYPDKLYEEFSA